MPPEEDGDADAGYVASADDDDGHAVDDGDAEGALDDGDATDAGEFNYDDCYADDDDGSVQVWLPEYRINVAYDSGFQKTRVRRRKIVCCRSSVANTDSFVRVEKSPLLTRVFQCHCFLI